MDVPTTSSTTTTNKEQIESKYNFEIGEKVLCFHGPLLYEAKCLKIDPTNPDDVKYFIHYNGWNKNYDEWVSEKRMLKVSEKNLKIQHDLLKSASKHIQNSVKRAQNKAHSSNTISTPPTQSTSQQTKNTSEFNNKSIKKKRLSSENDESSTKSHKRSNNDEKKRINIQSLPKNVDQFLTNNELKVRIPNELKDYLLDDWDMITRQNKLVLLPCKKTVADIIDEYMSYKHENSKIDTKSSIERMNETSKDLKEYFEVMIGSQLLYKFERLQYSQIRTEHKDKSMSDVYGFVHFLRLFAKLENMISFTPLNEATLAQLLNYVHDILKYLNVKLNEYSKSNEYILASPEYVRRVL